MGPPRGWAWRGGVLKQVKGKRKPEHPPDPRRTPGLELHQLQNATAYVVADDLRDLPGDLVDRYAAELQQWRRQEHSAGSPWVFPTALMIMALAGLFRGLRGGADGCGVQLSIEAWCRVLGRCERQVQYAFDLLESLGWGWHRRRLVKVKWIDPLGFERERADTYAVFYLSTLGFVRLNRRGTNPRSVEQRVTVKNGREHRSLFVGGLVGKLWTTLSAKIRVIALRVTDAKNRCTPTFGERRDEKLKTERGPVGAANPALSSRPQAPRSRGGDPPGAGMEAGLTNELELFRRGLLTPANAWPERWKQVNSSYRDRDGKFHEYDRRGRWWLIREAEQLVARFSREELLRLVASGAITRR